MFIICHIIFSSLIALLLSILWGNLTPAISATSMLLATALAFFAQKALREQQDKVEEKCPLAAYFIYALIFFIGTYHFLYLFNYTGKEFTTLLKNNYGDLPLHISYIKHFAAGGAFMPDNPIFAGEALRYPFGIDFYNALWESLGIPTKTHLMVVGLVVLVLSVRELRLFGGAFLAAAFFFNGGFAGYKLLSGAKLMNFQAALSWKSFFLSVFIPQRSFMFGLPLTLFLLRKFRRMFMENRFAETSGIRVLLFSLLWGSLAFFHLHLFLVFSLLAGFYYVSYCVVTTRLPEFKRQLCLVIPALLVGSTCILYATDFFSAASLISIKPGWEAADQSGGKHFLYWWQNTGPWLFFVPLACLFYSYKKMQSKSYRHILELAFVFFLFICFSNVMLAPWSWDNVKVLIPLYLLLSFFAYEGVKDKLTPAFYVPLCVILFFSGTVTALSTVMSANYKPSTLYSASELWDTQQAIESIPVDAVFAAAPIHNHPLGYFGRKLACGYGGHLWSHGINYQEREKKIKAIYEGDRDWNILASELGVEYLFWGNKERQRFKGDKPSWRETLEPVVESGSVKIYKVPEK